MTSAILTTILAWLVGLLFDANIDIDPTGFLELRTFLPIIVMGCFILKRLETKDK